MMTRSSSSSERAFGPFLGALVIALVITTGALAAALWRRADQFAASDQARQVELREFHADLLNRIESLAEKSGMLTSSDLCPVRFRIRFPDMLNFPMNNVRADLIAMGGGPLHRDVLARNGTIEFGLVPPGRYQIRLASSDTYVLEHTFDVLPGVPVDRLVVCPQLVPRHLSLALEVVWPKSMDSENLIAVCDIEPDHVALGDWTWEPTGQSRIRVVAGKDLQTLSDGDLGSIITEAEAVGADMVSGIPYRYCRVQGITVYRCKHEAGSGLVPVAQCLFTDDEVDSLARKEFEGSENASTGSVDIVRCRGSAPTFAWDGGALDAIWRIPAPEELVAGLR